MSLAYSKVPKASGLLRDYLDHYERLQAFYNGNPFDPAAYERVAADLQTFSTPRGELAEILLAQNRKFGAGERTLENIERLKEPGTFAVTTGQQVGLFTGPAFTLYKALTAVRLSESLTARGLKCVPVFWLATEDHDFEEVSTAGVFDDDYQRVALHDQGNRPSPRSPVGRIKLTSEIVTQLDRLETLLPSGDNGAAVIKDLRAAYQPGVSWGEAFGRMMARLFSKWGVILLDPLEEDIHRFSIPVYQAAVRNASEYSAVLQERTQGLLKAGYHAQVHIAEQSTLVFAEQNGNRLSLHRETGPDGLSFYTEDSRGLLLGDLDKQIAEHPLRFSANVLLRPIVQDMILPTLACVAGPSELAYLAQSGVLYSAFKRPMPVVFPRAGFTLVDHRVERWLAKYSLVVEDIWQGEEHVGEKIAATALAKGWSERFDETERDLDKILEGLRKDIQLLDPTLMDTLKHSEEKIRYQVERLRGKMTRAALQRSEVLERQEHALLRAIVPEKELQERMVSGVYFLGRAGYGILDQLLEAIAADSSGHHVLSYQGTREMKHSA